MSHTQGKSLDSCPTHSCVEGTFLGRSFREQKFSFPTFSKRLVCDGRVENCVCIPHLDRALESREGANLCFTLSWKYRVLKKIFHRRAGRGLWLCPRPAVTQAVGADGQGSPLG